MHIHGPSSPKQLGAEDDQVVPQTHVTDVGKRRELSLGLLMYHQHTSFDGLCEQQSLEQHITYIFECDMYSSPAE